MFSLCLFVRNLQLGLKGERFVSTALLLVTLEFHFFTSDHLNLICLQLCVSLRWPQRILNQALKCFKLTGNTDQTERDTTAGSSENSTKSNDYMTVESIFPIFKNMFKPFLKSLADFVLWVFDFCELKWVISKCVHWWLFSQRYFLKSYISSVSKNKNIDVCWLNLSYLFCT